MSFFIELLNAIWSFIRRIFFKVVNFFRNIVAFFKDPERLRKLHQDSNLMAISIKEKLDNGNYRVVNCLFDKSDNKVVDAETEALGIEAEYLDKDTAYNFGDKDMIILS